MTEREILVRGLMAVCCLCWTIAYVLAIARSVADKTYAIPLPAILANVMWEILFSTVFRSESPVGPVAIIWLPLDLVIFALAMKYWRTEFQNCELPEFVLNVVVGCLLCVGILYYSHKEGYEFISSAFPQNLMMSMMFVHMAYVRQDCRGQSIYIAILKFLGTGSAIVLASMPIESLSHVAATTFLAILFYDAFYICILFGKYRKHSQNPWRLF